jgi:hypothetical protein
MPDSYIKSAVSFVINPGTYLQTFKSSQADWQRLTGCEVVNPGDVTVFDESAKLGLNVIKLIESLPGCLSGVLSILMCNEYLESGRHRLVREAMDSSN